jgi:hypothetical protein
MAARKTKPKVPTVTEFLRELATIFATAARNRRAAAPAGEKLLIEHQKRSGKYLQSMLKQHELAIAKAQAAIKQINEQLNAGGTKPTKIKKKIKK